MENIIIVNPNDFWDKHREITKQVIKEELEKDKPSKENGEDILVIEDVCKLLKKSKQTIYNWMEADIIKGHRINESLFFFRSEIIDLLKSGIKEYKKR
ncbi:MAG TPA: helix-turn-helix domain-containing protein [Bacteroidales bacterium]|nr:helix-turn-helix domain-containing protein [Bacteroidales bacterium]